MTATIANRPGTSWTALLEREELQRRRRTRAAVTGAVVGVVGTGFSAALAAAQLLSAAH